MDISHFKLLKEDNENFHIGHPSGKSMVVAKSGLSSKAQGIVQKLKSSQMLADGGAVDPAQGKIILGDAPGNPYLDQSAEQMSQSMMSGAPIQISAPEGGVRFADGEEKVVPAYEAAVAQVDAPVEQRAPAAINPAAQKMAGSAFDSEMAANNKMAAAEAQQGQEESRDIQAAEQQVEKLPTQNEILNKFRAKDDELFQKYMDQKVDPERFYKNQSTGSKIAGALSLILGGIGSGITGGENVGLKMMQTAVERDIEAQKNEQGKAFNLYKMNQEAYGNSAAANLATQNQIYTGLQYKLKQAEANAKTPLALAKYQALNAQIAQKKSENNLKMSFLYPSAESGGGAEPATEQAHVNRLNGLKVVAPEMHKDEQDKYIPSVGVARRPLTSENRDALVDLSTLKDDIVDAKSFVNKVGTTVPWSDNDELAASKKNNIVLKLKRLNQVKGMNDSDLFKGLVNRVPNLGAIKSQDAIDKLTELDRQIDAQKKTLMNQLGVTPFKASSKDQVAIAWAKQNPNDPRAADILRAAGAR